MNKRRLKIVLLICTILLLNPINSIGHGGRTDSRGGHKDNKNASGLGSYHYHCGGYPAHLHEGGVCPYSSTTPTPSQETSITDSSQPTYSSTTTQETRATKTPEKIIAESINIDEENVELIIGDTKKLTATILPVNTVDKSITWVSENKDIADIDSNGNIVTYAVGTTKIIAKTSNGKEESIFVTVKPIEVKEIKISKTNIELIEGETETILTTIYPENATDKTLEWSVENPDVATVENGVIVSKSEGTTKIYCTSKDGVKAEINLIVNKEDIPEEIKNTVNNENNIIDSNSIVQNQPTEITPLTNMAVLIAIVELILLIVVGIKSYDKGTKINLKSLIGSIVSWIFVIISTVLIIASTSIISLVISVILPLSIAPPICRVINSKADGKYTVGKRIIVYIILMIILVTV